MHVFTHLKAESEGKTGLGVYPDGMVEHDGHVGRILARLDELGIADNTIVMWSTDNGAEELSWPDGGATLFRGEKDTNWEGGWRVPCMIRWPGVIKPGTVCNEIFSHQEISCATAHPIAPGEPNNTFDFALIYRHIPPYCTTTRQERPVLSMCCRIVWVNYGEGQ